MLQKRIINGYEFTFFNESKGNRSGFVHISRLFNEVGVEVSNAKVQYYNRTWESYPFRTSMTKAVENILDFYIDHYTTEFKTMNGYKKLTPDRRIELNNYLNEVGNIRDYRELLESL